jgi:hypothetical protein
MDLSVVQRSPDPRSLAAADASASSGGRPKFSFSVASLLATRVLHHHQQQQQQQQQQQLLQTYNSSGLSLPPAKETEPEGEEEEEEDEEGENDDDGSDISVDDDERDYDDPLQRRLSDEASLSAAKEGDDDFERRQRRLRDGSSPDSGGGNCKDGSPPRLAMPRPLAMLPPHLLPPGWPHPLLPSGLSSLNPSLFKSGGVRFDEKCNTWYLMFIC